MTFDEANCLVKDRRSYEEGVRAFDIHPSHHLCYICARKEECNLYPCIVRAISKCNFYKEFENKYEDY